MSMDWSTPIRHFGFLFGGAVNTFWIVLVVFVLSFIVGTLLAVLRFAKQYRIPYLLATIYVECIRNTPALVQIYLIYFGLPEFHILLPSITAGIIALTINNAAYLAEIIRAGIQSIEKGQWEAGTSLGLSWFKTFRFVIFPQALRNIFPAMANQFILLVLATSLLSIIDVRELTDRAEILNGETFRTMEIFVFVTVFYYAISWIVSAFLKWLNRRFFPAVSMDRSVRV